MNTSARPIPPTAAARAAQLTPDQLESLKPHVITLTDGRLDTNPTPRPPSAEEFATVVADIDAIFTTHLPNFIQAKGVGTVPIVLYAHGGLVGVEAGFATAHQQVQWWKDNGVYPIHFVWKTGLITAIWDAIGRFVAGGSRGWLADRKDDLIEKGARALGGEHVWLDMKLDAAASSDDLGGARIFVAKLHQWMKDNPDRASLHAVGHSAGSIFHSHLLPVAFEAGVPMFQTVTFLAPAVRMDTFRKLVLPYAEEAKIENLAIFTMTEKNELDDNCLKVYGKSLLHLISASFEKDPDTPILGLCRDIKADAAVGAWLKRAGGDLILTPNARSGKDASGADSHGSFNNDRRTMESVLLRVTGLSRPLKRFPDDSAHSRDPLENMVVPDSPRGPGGRTALCVGIDDYKKPADRLKGAVKDAELWATALRSAGFTVKPLTNSDATRQKILGELFRMVTTASPGDVLVFQYAGHGTWVPDSDGDEKTDGADEAICPVDFRDGHLIVDDDFARIWNLMPDGVSLTIFLDSCHSGGGSRRVTLGEESLPRGVRLSRQDLLKFRAARGMAAPRGKRVALDKVNGSEPDTTNKPVVEPPVQREILFAACTSNQLAWETKGQGDFTGAVAPILARHAGKLSNREFFDLITTTFDAHRQTPSFEAADGCAHALLLAGSGAAAPNEGTGESPGSDTDGAPGTPDRAPGKAGSTRDSAIAQILRGVADLLES